MTTSRTFRCRPEAVPAARLFVRAALGGQPEWIADAAELMASELATNCVRHAHTDFELTVESNGHIRVEVRDTGRGRPRLLSPAPRDESGRGLQIVEAMSDAWGVRCAADGKAVWFMLSPSGVGYERPRAALRRG